MVSGQPIEDYEEEIQNIQIQANACLNSDLVCAARITFQRAFLCADLYMSCLPHGQTEEYEVVLSPLFGEYPFCDRV